MNIVHVQIDTRKHAATCTTNECTLRHFEPSNVLDMVRPFPHAKHEGSSVRHKHYCQEQMAGSISVRMKRRDLDGVYIFWIARRGGHVW